MCTSVAREEVLHVVGHLLELGDLVLVLRVDRVELLVDRLQLLVGAVQLLVGGDQLLVGGLQLLVAGLHLLDGRLEVLLRMAELELERLDALAGEIVEGASGAGSVAVSGSDSGSRVTRKGSASPPMRETARASRTGPSGVSAGTPS